MPPALAAWRAAHQPTKKAAPVSGGKGGGAIKPGSAADKAMERRRGIKPGSAADKRAEAGKGGKGGGGAGGGLNFSSKAGYQKWLAYGHMHGDFERTPGNTPVAIQGEAHAVSHGAQHGARSRTSRPK